MQKFTWTAKLKPNMKAEYKRRHDEIWTEMKEVLSKAGVVNYTIWVSGDTLFGYYECEDIDYAIKVQSQSPVVDKWNEYMQDVMDIAHDENTGYQPCLEKMFSFKER